MIVAVVVVVIVIVMVIVTVIVRTLAGGYALLGERRNSWTRFDT